MTWRYSVGNVYEELSYAEALDVAQVMAGYGYRDVARQILRYTLRRLPARFTYWRTGERMVAGAQYFRLTGDGPTWPRRLPALLRRHVSRGPCRSQRPAPARALLLGHRGHDLQPAGSDPRLAGAAGDEPRLGRDRAARVAPRARSLGLRLDTGCAGRSPGRSAACRRLPVRPCGLLDGSAPFDRLTDSRNGTYWNLVAPYALARGSSGRRRRGEGADPVPAEPRVAAAGPGSRGRVPIGGADRRCPAPTGVRQQCLAVPRRQRRARPARPQPLRRRSLPR